MKNNQNTGDQSAYDKECKSYQVQQKKSSTETIEQSDTINE